MSPLEHYQNIMKVVIEAVRFACQKEHLSEDHFFRSLQAGEENTHSRLRYALAKGITHYLGSIDDNLESAYVYGSTMDDNAGCKSDIDLLVKVKSKSGRTRKVLEILDSLLLASYRILLDDDEFGMNCMLDVHMVDEEDIQSRKHYGSLLSSADIVPVKVWSRA
jgi:predicted nucleotidyltransferase